MAQLSLTRQLASPKSRFTHGATLADSCISFMVGDNHYLARPLHLGVQHSADADTANPDNNHFVTPTLLTTFNVAKDQVIDVGTLQSWRTEVLDMDDVFHEHFLEDVVFVGVNSAELQLTSGAQSLLQEWGTKAIEYNANIAISNGPYLVNEGIFHSVWRVYEDYQLGFTQAVWPEVLGKEAFTEVPASGAHYRGHGIAVPARSYTNLFGVESDGDRTSRLRGMRFAVKDNYHVCGTRTTLGNRAFSETYPVQSTTATVVRRLLNAGAHLVGKSHLSSFAMMEHPTQSVDFQAAFNPRGDGYLIPGGSSSGSASAIATYDWLDIAICTDTTGSARIPAFQTGLFGFRPSLQTVSNEGMVHAWEAFDTPGWIGRDLNIFPDLIRVLSDASSEESPEKSAAPLTILYPEDFLPLDSPDQVDAMKDFIHDAEKNKGYMHRMISIHDDWHSSSPVPNKDLRDYLYNMTLHGWFYAAYHSFDSFRQEYEEKHGYPPFVTEVVRWYWEIGREVSDDQHQEVMNRLSVFRKWFIERYMSSESTIYPGDNNPNVPGLRATYLSAILGAPELAIPISEISYSSRITKREEKLPLVVSLMGKPGTDLELVTRALNILKESKRPTQVKTGKTCF
ncbi:amidase signature domain-containing protein [Xylariaceae sp. FL1019]|nr:amidase signature domain-containing protein [Xylariaceae sp. FL1019]